MISEKDFMMRLRLQANAKLSDGEAVRCSGWLLGVWVMAYILKTEIRFYGGYPQLWVPPKNYQSPNRTGHADGNNDSIRRIRSSCRKVRESMNKHAPSEAAGDYPHDAKPHPDEKCADDVPHRIA